MLKLVHASSLRLRFLSIPSLRVPQLRSFLKIASEVGLEMFRLSIQRTLTFLVEIMTVLKCRTSVPTMFVNVSPD